MSDLRDTNSLRLRLVVQRHALPEVRIVFAVQLGTDPTIANLLEQIDEIVPLESSHWGLEDYAVELRDASGHGFDCLHFQRVVTILRSDEQVFIRPLVTGDRRKRRLSGRDQISADGKHLIDGVAFGRPRLKPPRDRPYVEIPPLKRRRVTREALEEEEEEEEPRLLLTEHGEDDTFDRRVRSRTRAEDLEEGHADQDGDFVAEDSDKGLDEGGEGLSSGDDSDDADLENELLDLGLENELLDLQADNEEWQAGEHPTNLAEGGSQLDLDTLDKISALRTAFPTTQAAACEKALARHGGSTQLAYSALQRKHQPRIALAAVLDTAHPSTGQATPTVDDDEDESEAESVASIVKHYDQHGFPSGSILAGTAAAEMVRALRKSGHSVKPPVHTKFDDAVEAQVGRLPSPRPRNRGTTGDGRGASPIAPDLADHSEPDSEADSGSDNDSGPEVASSKLPDAPGGAKLGRTNHPARFEERARESESESGDESDPDTSSDDSDNEPEDDSNDASSSDSSSDSGGGSDSDDDANDNATYEDNSTQSSDAHGSDDSSAESSSDESDSSSDSEAESSADEANEAHPTQKTLPVVTLHSAPQPAAALKPEAKSAPAETPRAVLPGQGKITTKKRNARRRLAHLRKTVASGDPESTLQAVLADDSQDLAASIANKKAALLQSLNVADGHATVQPGDAANNGEDEALAPSQGPGALRDASSRLAWEPPPIPHVQDQSASHNPEAWRDKITYRAVECCQEGVELSEPPFPFVQRWDPQQQYFHEGNKRGGGSKRKQRNQGTFQEAGGRSRAKRRRHGGPDDWSYETSYVNHDGTSGYQDMLLNYDDEVQETEEQVQQRKQPQHQPADDVDNDNEDDDDLPPLPADTSALPALNPSEALAGMVLTWKQWLLSKATSWQPQISALTGIVVEVLDGNALTVRLAKRDRNIDRSEKTYDEDGNRVYDKFELPGMDEESEEAVEEGYRTLDLADMIEPRILQAAPGAPEPRASPRCPSQPSQQEAPVDQIQDYGLAQSDDDRGFVTPDEATSEKNAVEPAALDVGTQKDRRQEISLLINNAGFRKDLDPSVTTSLTDAMDLSSPSRQLEQLDGSSMPLPEPSETRARPILLEPFHGFSDPILEPQDEPSVRYPTWDLPPSETGSLHSGRQVQLDFSLELGHGSFPDLEPDATVSRSTLGCHDDDEEESNGDEQEDDEQEDDNAQEDDDEEGSDEDGYDEEGDDDNQDATSEEPDNHSESESDSSDVSFPSLSEVWMSASASGRKPPSKDAVLSAIKARKSAVSADAEYDETMRRLDNSEMPGDDDEVPLSKPAQRLASKRTEMTTPKRLSPSQRAVKPSPAPSIKIERVPSASRAGRTSSPFVVPEGSQVASLLSSSPERELEEHYAEDSIDDTYEEPNMPSGSSWVKKSRPRRGNPEPVSVSGRSIVSSSMPATTQSGWKQKGGKKSTATLSSLLWARKNGLSILF
ncbi:hypothetical protein C8A05DRAFT_32089 [Staphylotrichum tortipilum]|uniref:DUF7357 domain-containing protein n=1 Tax=Staphylotrichum tortipilum TaxID=2831512 RepID=A0AAN6MPH6_9PEZI|nr:hypothetical protein C8A05DRAFT_32089 [Staphylotrichum longicolle]